MTADIPLADRCLKAGAAAIGSTGIPFTTSSIGMAMANRELLSNLRAMGEIQADFAAIPMGGTGEAPTPHWLNAWCPALDGMALTAMLRKHNPARMVEIGSGMSTKFARRAVGLYGLKTRIASIDPS